MPRATPDLPDEVLYAEKKPIVATITFPDGSSIGATAFSFKPLTGSVPVWICKTCQGLGWIAAYGRSLSPPEQEPCPDCNRGIRYNRKMLTSLSAQDLQDLWAALHERGLDPSDSWVLVELHKRVHADPF